MLRRALTATRRIQSEWFDTATLGTNVHESEKYEKIEKLFKLVWKILSNSCKKFNTQNLLQQILYYLTGTLFYFQT